MGKQKKKRDKKYHGVDAAIKAPIITRVSASNRSKVGQLWFENKKRVITISKVMGISAIVIISVIEIIKLIAG